MSRTDQIYHALKTKTPFNGKYIVGVKEAIELAAGSPKKAVIEFPATAMDVPRPEWVRDWNEILKENPTEAKSILDKMIRNFYPEL